MAYKHRLCKQGELSHDQCGEFTLSTSEHEREFFFIQLKHGVRCFENNCPHTGVALNWNPNVFLDKEGRYIQCSLHGALFDKVSGKCVFGPCAGQFLTHVETRLEDDVWYAILSH